MISATVALASSKHRIWFTSEFGNYLHALNTPAHANDSFHNVYAFYMFVLAIEFITNSEYFYMPGEEVYVYTQTCMCSRNLGSAAKAIYVMTDYQIATGKQ